jgi:hypothetical protein
MLSGVASRPVEACLSDQRIACAASIPMSPATIASATRGCSADRISPIIETRGRICDPIRMRRCTSVRDARVSSSMNSSGLRSPHCIERPPSPSSYLERSATSAASRTRPTSPSRPSSSSARRSATRSRSHSAARSTPASVDSAARACSIASLIGVMNRP